MTPAPLPEPSDQALVAAYRHGDQRAASELVRRHGPAVARFLYGSGALAADIEDLVQETLFRAFRGLDRWRGEASFRSWLFTIAGNLTRDAFRRRKGREMISLEDRDLPDRADPDAELAAGELEERLRAELGRLPLLVEMKQEANHRRAANRQAVKRLLSIKAITPHPCLPSTG